MNTYPIIPNWIRALKNVPCVYGAKLKGTQMWYIGSCKCFYKRYAQHKRRALNPDTYGKTHVKNKFYVAIREHGWDAFEWDPRPQPAFMLKQIENDSIIAADSIANGFNSLDAYGRGGTGSAGRTGSRYRGICPKCKTNKRHIRKSGIMATYCTPCESARRNEYRRIAV